MEGLRCSVCHEEKPPGAFNRNRRYARGRSYLCRVCRSKRRLQVARANPERHEAEKEWKRKRRQAGGRSYWPSQLEWWRRNKDKARTHKAVAKAIVEGRLVRPSECERCGRERKLDGHHEDYLKPLQVEWLCSPCHRQQHGYAA